jgi:uncharacterized protein YciI
MWGAGSCFSLGRASFVAFVASTSSQRACFSSSATTRLSAVNYLLKYDYIPEVLEKRGPHREGHLSLAQKLIDEGKCLSGGPTGPPGVSPPTGALFIFTDEDSANYFFLVQNFYGKTRRNC